MTTVLHGIAMLAFLFGVFFLGLIAVANLSHLHAMKSGMDWKSLTGVQWEDQRGHRVRGVIFGVLLIGVSIAAELSAIGAWR